MIAKYFSPRTPIAVMRLGAIFNIVSCILVWPVLMLGCAQLNRIQLVALLPSLLFAFTWPKFLYTPSVELSRFFLLFFTCVSHIVLMYAGYKWLLRVAICAVLVAFLLEMLRGGQRENLVLSLGNNLAGIIILVLGMTWAAGIAADYPVKQRLSLMLLLMLVAITVPFAMLGFTTSAIVISLCLGVLGTIVIGISISAVGIGAVLLCVFWVTGSTIILCYSVKFVPVPSANVAIAIACAVPLVGGMAFTAFPIVA